MFNPSRDEVRRFFRDLLTKKRDGGVLTPLETVAGDWVERHPEYFPVLAPVPDGEPGSLRAARRRAESVPAPVDAPVDRRAARDRPAEAGIRAAVERLARVAGIGRTTRITR